MSSWIVLVTLLALLFYFFTSVNVVRTRVRTKVYAPAMSGHPDVERALRVQGNTLEWIVIFLPSLWLWSYYLDARVGAVLGAIWIVGRILYLVGYMKDAGKRGPGFLVQGSMTAILFFGALIGVLATLLGHPLGKAWF
ncbi:MAG TPA: MAPEG family protein [Caulobacteraceae bacterium]|jgi:glutathione S-transferase|nr:MAPEG family protein [Caulobacteraceae bacterium]